MNKLPFLAALLTLAAPAFADVIIYTGTGKVVSATADGTFTVPAKVTTITDVTTLQSRVVFALTAKVGPFKQKTTNTTAITNVGRAETLKGKVTATTFASGITNYTNAGNFLYSLVKFTGAKSSVVVRTGSAGVNFPKALSGTTSAVNQTSVGTSTIAVKFSASASTMANAANQTLDAATAAVVAQYRADGYDDDQG